MHFRCYIIKDKRDEKRRKNTKVSFGADEAQECDPLLGYK